MTKIKSLTPFHEEYLADTVAQIRDLYFFGIDEDKIQYDCYKGDNERILYEEKYVVEDTKWAFCLKYLTDKKPNIFDSLEEVPENVKRDIIHANQKIVKFTEYPECWEFVVCTKDIEIVKLYKKQKYLLVIRKGPISKLTITKSGYAKYRNGKTCFYVSPNYIPSIPLPQLSSSTFMKQALKLHSLFCSISPNNEWVRSIDSTSLFSVLKGLDGLPPVSGPMFRTFTSYRQFWEYRTGRTYILNVSIRTMINLKEDLTKEEIFVFINRDDVKKLLAEHPFREFAFGSLYRLALGKDTHYPNGNLVNDCVRMARVLREPIKLKIKSWAKMVEWHEKLRKRYLLRDLEDIQVDPVYPTLTADCSYVIEKIETKERLAKEAIELHHCVNSYTDRINSGDCAIYSILDGKQRYTAEVVHENRQFKLNQLRGNCNSAPPTELEEFFTKLLDQVSLFWPLP